MIDTCRHCHAKTLEVVACHISYMTGVAVTTDGFALSDAKQQHTEQETVYCTSCKAYGMLEHDDPASFLDDETCSDSGYHACYDNDRTCSCRCEGCVDETEPKCDRCNQVLNQDGRCPL